MAARDLLTQVEVADTDALYIRHGDTGSRVVAMQDNQDAAGPEKPPTNL